MKNIFIVFSLISTFITGYYFGNKEYEIPSLKKLDGVRNAKLFDYTFSDDDFVGTVDVQNFINILQNAYWKNDSPKNKGSFKFQLNKGINILVSYYGNFYWIEGVDGYFVLKNDSDVKKSELFLNDILKKRLIPWRKQKHTEPTAAPDAHTAARP